MQATQFLLSQKQKSQATFDTMKQMS